MKTLFTLTTLSRREAYATVRKTAVPAQKPMKDKRNDYQRKPKFGNQW